jgi:hypothetical protein
MFRTMSVGLVAGSAAVVGLVWGGRALFTRLKPQKGAPQPALADGAEAGAEGEALDAAARRDALHDMREGHAIEVDSDARDSFDDLDIEALEARDDPRDRREERDEDGLEADDDPEDIDIEVLDFGETVGVLELPTAVDEPYDAVDAEDVGAAWLLRATQATPPVGWNAHDVLEGNGHVIESRDGASDAMPSERGYGRDQEGAPFAEYAGTHEEDLAAELPVGTVDAEGNVGLRTNPNPPDALGAPPTGQLSPTAQELARRAKG